MPNTFRLPIAMMAAVLALIPLPGLAQTSGQAPKPKPPAAKQQPAKEQPAPKNQQAQPPRAAPVVVQLKGSPSQPEWTKVCGKDERANAETCYTTRDFVTDKGQRIVAVALYDVKAKNAPKTLRILMPLGLLVPPGVLIAAEKSQPVAGRYSACLPHGCFAEAAVKDDLVAALKKGAALTVSARNQGGKEVTFAVPTDGFGKAFDGPPVDPQVLAEQQKKIQEELQKQAEDQRSRRMGNPGQAPEANPAEAEVKN
ncbi:invasion associated locus B family protein [Microvirga sp. CF3062]|uniref:invasion associated locus B family protein n=1 Tax=Microvirga sp. CF3062 TaxID=3110182 RepID=UPI002E7A3E70|nr:invasion associated locus B family protein [Microvirga sp. CF3062]MEE1657910.1 invasion associated locus B family protein [Microvirga sp. CF3062]